MKRVRLDSIEIETVANNAWEQVLSISTKASLPNLKDVVNKPIYENSYTILNEETIKFINNDKHQQYNACKINFNTPKSNESSTNSDSDVDSDVDSDIENLIEQNIKIILRLQPKLKPSEFYSQFVARTSEQCIEELAAPQKSDKWLQARSLCITASQFGSAVGESPYQTPDDLVLEKLWNTFQGNSATQWGNDHEPHAKEAFVEWFEKYLKKHGGSNFQFIEENLMKFSEEPWMAVSPDGIIKYTLNGINYIDLIEFKCPAYLRNTSGHPYEKYPQNTPTQYKAQTQGIMGHLNKHHPEYKITQCWFVVWQPHQTWITHQPYDPQYFDMIYEKLRDWYFTKLLPAFTHKHNNLLIRGTSCPQEPINIEKLI